MQEIMWDALPPSDTGLDMTRVVRLGGILGVEMWWCFVAPLERRAGSCFPQRLDRRPSYGDRQEVVVVAL